jgi:hypothetical protein
MELVADSAAVERRRKHGRSRVSNGALLAKTDGRTAWARIMRDTFRELVVHCGGDAEISETRRLIARRVSTLEAELVYLEDRFAATRAEGGEPDPAAIDLYGRLADRQRRLADPLGWQRTPRNVTPSPGDYLAAKHAHDAESLTDGHGNGFDRPSEVDGSGDNLGDA